MALAIERRDFWHAVLVHTYRVHDLPPFVLAPVVVGGMVLVSLVGMALTRPLARRFFGPGGNNEVVGDVLRAAGAFYGITLGLSAVGAWSASGDAQTKVANENRSRRNGERGPPPKPSPL